jgi:hypothetical protein
MADLQAQAEIIVMTDSEARLFAASPQVSRGVLEAIGLGGFACNSAAPY